MEGHGRTSTQHASRLLRWFTPTAPTVKHHQCHPHSPTTLTHTNSHNTMPPSPTSAIGLARGIAFQARRQTSTALKRPLPSSSSSSSASSPLHFSGHRKSFFQLQQPQRDLATETTQATPVPPPPPSGRNRVYPAVLLITLALVGYVVMT